MNNSILSIITTILLIFIYLNIKIINGEPTVEQCDKIWTSETIYNYTECSCFQDLKICQYSLQIHLICSNEILVDYFKNLKTCDLIYSDCSLKENNECKIGMCNCFKSMINCMNENKCTPYKAESTIKKRERSSIKDAAEIN